MKEYRIQLDDQLAGALLLVMQIKGYPTFSSAICHILIQWLSEKGYL